MTNYTFLVREWNVSFFVKLKERIRMKNPESTFQFTTMQHLAYEQILEIEGECIYLPEFFEQVELNDSRYKDLDSKLRAKFGCGINRVYDLERYKPNTSDESEHLKYSHTLGLDNLLKVRSILIGLTMDHFVYVLAGLLNELKGGQNFFLQPVGFPLNANVVYSNPWKLRKLNTRTKGTELQDYMDSLNLQPEESIHYMKKPTIKSRGLTDRVADRIVRRKATKRAQKYLRFKYNYLDNQLRWLGLKPAFAVSNNGWYKSSLGMEKIMSLSEKGKLFYFPLQLEPEMSTLAYSPWLRSQAELIRLISMTLHVGDVLLLKENPKMKGQRSQAFYDEIEKFDNVRWASFKINSREIIRQAFKTLSITGTACIEAACLGKMSLIVGYSPWKMMLTQNPISETPLIELETELYKEISPEEVVSKVKSGYSEYEKALFLDNLIPHGKNERWNCAQLTNVDGSVEKMFKLLKDNLCAES